MNSIITEGILVSVAVTYRPEHSSPLQHEFVFTYTITLENHNHYPVKLLRRNWHIFDSNGMYRIIDGEGVVGVQPVIQAGCSYQYTSACNLNTEMGKMKGAYEMENLLNKKRFKVEIPKFEMVTPFKAN